MSDVPVAIARRILLGNRQWCLIYHHTEQAHAHLRLSDIALLDDLLHDVILIVRAKLTLKLLVRRSVQNALRAMPTSILSACGTFGHDPTLPTSSRR